MSFSSASLPGSIMTTPTSRLSAIKIATGIFAILGALYLVWPLWRIGFPLDANRNEGWHGWYIDAVGQGLPLYPGADEMRVNNYPPLSFMLTSAVARLTGDAILAGRLLSLASLFVMIAAAGMAVRALGGSRVAAAFAAFWLFATLTQFFEYYVGVNDPSLLAIALMGLGLAYFLRCMEAGRAVEPAIALMVIAGFFKHNFPGVPAVALIWLALIDKKAALRATLFGAFLCALGVALCVVAFGPDFLNDMMMPREIKFMHVFFAANRLQWIAPAVVVWALWAWPNRKQPAAQFTALFILVTLLNGLYTAAGAGVTYNAYLAVTFASAIALGLAIEGLGSTGIGRSFTPKTVTIVVISVLLLRLVLWPRYEYYLVLTSPSFREDYRQASKTLNNEIARVRAIPGNVACEPLIICYRAGKAFVYERYWVDQLLLTGRRTKESIDKGVKDRAVRFELGDPAVSFPKKLLF